MIMLSDDAWSGIIDDFAKKLHDGGYAKGAVPTDLYFKTAKQLAGSITELGSSFAYDDPKNSLAAQFRANLYQFSGAKSLTEATAFNDLLLDEAGNLKPFNQFRQDVEKLHGLYNEHYLSAEYQNAVASAQSADQWSQWNPEDWLMYSTAGDDRVRPAHAVLDGLTLQASDSVWNRIYPPNDWGCRCNVVPAINPKPTSEQDAKRLSKIAVTNPIFDNNPGKTGIVFKDDHPYFNSLDGLKQLEAVKNYGMRKARSIMTETDLLPAIASTPTETDYYIWWQKMVEDYPASENSFALKDKMGNQVLFKASPDGKKKNAFFRDKIMHDDDKAHEYAKNLVDIIQKSDEIWYQQGKKNLTAVYVKYYQDAPYVVTAEIGDSVISAESVYKAETGLMEKVRNGILIFKK